MAPPTNSVIKQAREKQGAVFADLEALYDLRRTYANWLESAGIPRTRRRIYRGHEARDMGDLYEWHEVEQFLVEDAAKLRAYVFGTESTGLKLEKA